MMKIIWATRERRTRDKRRRRMLLKTAGGGIYHLSNREALGLYQQLATKLAKLGLLEEQ